MHLVPLPHTTPHDRARLSSRTCPAARGSNRRYDPHPYRATVHSHRSLFSSAAGFTLIEAALVTVIVGIGVLAIVAAQQAYHQQNDHAQRTGAGLMLANEIRELMFHLPVHDPIYGDTYFGPEPGEDSYHDYNDIDDFAGPDGDGTLISPPITATRETIDEMDQWSQHITVKNVLPSHISTSSPAPDGSTAVLRVTCRVLYQGPEDDSPREITRLTWVRAGDGS